MKVIPLPGRIRFEDLLIGTYFVLPLDPDQVVRVKLDRATCLNLRFGSRAIHSTAINPLAPVVSVEVHPDLRSKPKLEGTDPLALAAGPEHDEDLL